MKERPIIFSGEMVKAILEGRKTQTRRPLSQQPLDVLPANLPNCWVALVIRDPEIGNKGVMFRSRYGIPGDRLWVKETWAPMCRVADPFCECDEEAAKTNHYIEYRADTGNALPGDWPEESRHDEGCPKWKSGRFMPRAKSRITLEVVRVRVERVPEITRADCVAEGLPPTMRNDSEQDIRVRFYELWNSINAKRGFGWDVNPWVWVIEFKRVTTNEERINE
jgi:hypothetical protein